MKLKISKGAISSSLYDYLPNARNGLMGNRNDIYVSFIDKFNFL